MHGINLLDFICGSYLLYDLNGTLSSVTESGVDNSMEQPLFHLEMI